MALKIRIHETNGNTFNLPGVKILNHLYSYRYGAEPSNEVSLDDVQYVPYKGGHVIMPKDSRPNSNEQYWLTVQSPDNKVIQKVTRVSDVSVWTDIPHLDSIKASDGFIFIYDKWNNHIYIYKQGIPIAKIYAQLDTARFFVPQEFKNGKVVSSEWDERLPATTLTKLTASKLKDAANFILKEYSRISTNNPVKKQVNRDAVRKAVGNYLFDKFKDVIDYCDSRGYTTEQTIKAVKQAINTDYNTTDPGAM